MEYKFECTVIAFILSSTPGYDVFLADLAFVESFQEGLVQDVILRVEKAGIVQVNDALLQIVHYFVPVEQTHVFHVFLVLALLGDFGRNPASRFDLKNRDIGIRNGTN